MSKLTRALEDCQIHSMNGFNVKIDPNKPLSPSVEDWSVWVRSIRGGMLAGAFYVERNIDIAIESYFLGSMAGADDERSSLFVETVVNPLTLDRKINLITRIHKMKFEEIHDQFSDGLGKVKSIRNAMAHNACWLEPVISADGYVIAIKPYIMIGKNATCLIDPTIPNWNLLMQQMITMTENLANYLIDPQSVPKEIPTVPS